jgi:xylulokinase
VKVAGVDSSTQSCKVVVCDAESGAVVDVTRAAHPDGTEVDPEEWWRALSEVSAPLADVSAVGVGGQQHGMVVLDEAGAVVRPALLWNDNRSARAATDLMAELGGQAAWAEAVGSTLVASFTVTKLRWFAEHEPELAARAASVLLPHDWLTWRLTGADPTTDRGDASGTGYWSPAIEEYRLDLLERAFGRVLAVPRVAAPSEVVGQTAHGAAVSAGTGDNMAAALGLGVGPGDIVVSLGTSGTAFAVAEHATADRNGDVAGFADATGRYLPLVCTLNAARVVTASAGLLGVDPAEFDRLALAAPPGSGGLTLLPYLDGERTPPLPDAAGSLLGIRRDNLTAENIARASVEGVLCGLADGVDALRAVGVEARRVLLIGGAAQSAAMRAIAPQVFGLPVDVPATAEYVAVGAARQATWASTGELPDWPIAIEQTLACSDGDVAASDEVRGRYAERRLAVHGV